MPNCAPTILELVMGDEDPNWTSSRCKWRVKREFGSMPTEVEEGLIGKRQKLSEGEARCVKTFVADEWTLEYDLAYCGRPQEVYMCAVLAANDDPLNEDKKKPADVTADAQETCAALMATAAGDHEVLCTSIYEMFTSKRASRAIAAQYLADFLIERSKKGELDGAWPKARLPKYIKNAISFATTPLVFPEQGVAE